VLYPRARVLTLVIIIFFFTVIELPAYVMLGVWFALNALLPAVGQIGQSGSAGGVAYFAHVGGFVFGLLAIRVLAQRRKEIGYGPKYPVY
jgi:membrane associated rhomboid family serine protease